MKFHSFILVLAIASTSQAAGLGGRIIRSAVTNAQVKLTFNSSSNYQYQVQRCSKPGCRYWSDVVSMTATGSTTTASVPMPGQSGFFRVLEFTNQAFWYDWKYYQAPTLNTWNLSAPQSGYAHLDRSYEWYIDQGLTGPYSGNNCGPSSVTMAIKWYDASFSKTAADARSTYLEGGGWWWTYDILNYLSLYSIPNMMVYFTGTDQLAGILSQGDLVILCLNTAYFTLDTSPEHRTGKFYSFSGGHFLVVKGWRMTSTGLWFEVYDPNNWGSSYADSTPRGRNRHISAVDLYNAITSWWSYLIIVYPPSGAQMQSALLQGVDPATAPHMPGR